LDEREAAGAAPRLCDGRYRYRAPGTGWSLGDWSSREDDRLRVSRHARDDAEVQADRQGVLRAQPSVLVFQGMLDRRPYGVDGGAALPGRLRWHHRRVAGGPL